ARRGRPSAGHQAAYECPRSRAGRPEAFSGSPATQPGSRHPDPGQIPAGHHQRPGPSSLFARRHLRGSHLALPGQRDRALADVVRALTPAPGPRFPKGGARLLSPTTLQSEAARGINPKGRGERLMHVLGIAFLVPLLISWVLTAVLLRLAPRLGLVDDPGARQGYTRRPPRGG